MEAGLNSSLTRYVHNPIIIGLRLFSGAMNLKTARKSAKSRSRSGADAFFNTAHWVIIAFALTIIFLVFEMQAYTIPTGSMADTLHGAHFRLRCPQCGYRYDHDFVAEIYQVPSTKVPSSDVPLLPANDSPFCPSCGFWFKGAYERMSVAGNIALKDQYFPVIAGDRIFVHKCIYQFVRPSRWDVVVFRTPLEPRINYIKRMIGLPGETVQIIDGDIYIDGVIARKPPKVQEELWMPVYDNNYQPARPEMGPYLSGSTWKHPFRNEAGSGWVIAEDNPHEIRLESADNTVHTVYYDTAVGNDFQARHAYDRLRQNQNLPICSDLRITFDIKEASEDAIFGAVLSKYGTVYRATVSPSGQGGYSLSIERQDAEGRWAVLTEDEFFDPRNSRPTQFGFANVDHTLVARCDENLIAHDLGESAESLGERRQVMPEVKIFGTDTLSLANISICRDLHYISETTVMPIRQGADGEPFTLNEKEYFVLGDNTLASADSRMWDRPGLANYGQEYRQGTVPEDYLVGKAFFVYWPGPTKPLERFKLIPYPSGIKLIFGGSKQSFLSQ